MKYMVRTGPLFGAALLAFVLGVASMPAAAFAAPGEETTVVATTAVTRSVEIGGIRYVPRKSHRTSEAQESAFIGMVETAAVTAPIEIGGILYVPPGGEANFSVETSVYIGVVETTAVTAPIAIGGILYVPPGWQGE